jgi:hypothetical protein
MATRQVLYPPFGVGTRYKIFTTTNPLTGRLFQYTGPWPFGVGFHRFVGVQGGEITAEEKIVDTNPPTYGTHGTYIGLATNTGGRRRKSRRSKRSHRKTKRRHH